ncbi:hypothetical protein BDV98DRAFT_572361 [Pterulicium gracile]|uniref:Uncharacterized protein n=1 Tax=Pterulicium gracile TaxID=1884261 RepID=A0A5C3QFG3_9AGAR|nr:hypothetical protein BDV98DRAFT_572361 [Pterula gracilis]
MYVHLLSYPFLRPLHSFLLCSLFPATSISLFHPSPHPRPFLHSPSAFFLCLPRACEEVLGSLRNSDGLYSDGLDDQCTSTGHPDLQPRRHALHLRPPTTKSLQPERDPGGGDVQ